MKFRKNRVDQLDFRVISENILCLLSIVNYKDTEIL